jgi:AraC-like DNA-binding protein
MALFLDEVSGDLRLEAQEASIVVTNRIADAPARRFADETFLVMVHGLMCWLVGKRIPPSLADHHLCNSALSIADIGGLLGFQEASAFHRAFKKWSGVQPGEYRLRQTRATGTASSRSGR